MSRRCVHFGLGLFVFTLLAGCTKSTPPTPPDGFDRNAMLGSLTQRVIAPGYVAFAESAETLRVELQAWRDAATTTVAASARGRAQVAYRSSMRAWQRMEAMQVGPAGSPTVMTGGRLLRDEIYSWPTFSHCRVDQVTVSGDYVDPSFVERELVNVYGLDALEYLLFTESAGNVCAAPVPINRDGTWAALGDDEVWKRRAAYAYVVAADVKRLADELSAAWATGGSFAPGFVAAGQAGSPFSTAQEAIDQLFAALFYVDQTVKDEKLVKPAGLDPVCGANTCPDMVETRLADTSRDNIEANLEGLRALLTGAYEGEEAGLGFDDFLVAVGAEAVSVDLIQRVDDALVAVRAMNAPIEDLLVSDLGAVRNLQALVKRVTDLLKSQFVSVLNLKLPDEGAADND